jgi:hypothetical protein
VLTFTTRTKNVITCLFAPSPAVSSLSSTFAFQFRAFSSSRCDSKIRVHSCEVLSLTSLGHLLRPPRLVSTPIHYEAVQYDQFDI